MRLRDYPRPPDDNGIGMHWSSGNPTAVGAADLRATWLPALQRMGVKWVKFLHDGGLEFAALLLEAEIMPVVRLYRAQPNSTDIDRATLEPRQVEQLKQYVALGVRYFEFNNEPDVAAEWLGGQAPPDAVDHVARAAIRDMETILAAGGYPAVPATAIGNRWDLLGKIIEHGGRSLLDGPVWLAVHNYDINHPLDYPLDGVNQRGDELAQADYDSMGMDSWSGRRWGPRARDFINQQRRSGANPGHTIHQDASCFHSYQRFADLCQQHLGRHLPILSTENGPIVGEDDDPRYPTTTPRSHAQKVVDIAGVMMGASDRFAAAPPYYFCTAFWLLANSVLRGTGWEAHAWYSPTWPDGRLPAVDALAALPKTVRPIPLDDGEPEADDPSAEYSMIAGVISGHPATRVILRSPTFAAETTTDDQAIFRFENLPAGVYRLSVPGASIVRTDLRVDGYSQLRVDIIQPAPVEPPPPPPPPPAAPDGWQATISDAGPSPGFGIVRVAVDDKPGLPVQISASGWDGYVQFAGSKAEYGPDALEFAPLGSGAYTITPAEIGISAEVNLDAARVLMVAFTPGSAEAERPAAGSAIGGKVANGAGHTIVLRGPEGELSRVVASDETYRFESLAAGAYTLFIPDSDQRRSGLEMDGSNERTANFALPAPLLGQSSVLGQVPGGAGLEVSLSIRGGQSLVQVLGEDERFEFSALAAGEYRLAVSGPEGEIVEAIQLDGSNRVDVTLTLPAPAMDAWQAAVSDGGPGPGFGVVRVKVEGQAGLAVRIWTSGWEGMVRRTGEKPEYGEFALEFAPLGSGHYFVEPEGLGVRAEVTTDGSRVAWVTFGRGVTAAAVPVEEPAPKSITHYLLLGKLPSDLVAFAAIVRYAAQFQPVVGVEVAEAAQAEHVTILGSDEVSGDAEWLAESGCQVELLDFEQAAHILSQRVAGNIPY